MIFVPGHFGEWLQGRLGLQGPVVLVTLACPHHGVRVSHQPGEFTVTGASRDQAAQLLARLNLPLEGCFAIETDFPAGGGTGISTAALIGMARAAGSRATKTELAEACLAVEGASDPLLFERPDALLWASREARVICQISPPPPCDILGGFFGTPEVTNPRDTRFPDVSDLVAQWERAETLEEYAQIASASARRCTEMRGPENDPTEQLARDLGALGYVRAHTGSARALVFPPGRAPEQARTQAEKALRAAGFSGVCHFTTGGKP